MAAMLHAATMPQASLRSHLHAPSGLCLAASLPHRRPCSSLKRVSLHRAAAVYAPSAPPSAAPTTSGPCTPEELRAHLVKKGWRRAWLDGIQERQAKGEFTTTVDSAEQLVSFLEALGIPSQSVCNMASLVPKILGVEESTAKELVDFLKGRGLNAGEVAGVLQRHPKLLTFSKVGQGALENGRMRAEAGKDDAGRVWVNIFREGAYRKNPPQ